jgi:alpha-galactosidase
VRSSNYLASSINAGGITGTQFGELPEGIAEFLRREISISHLTVDAVVHGDRQLALQALLLDPVIRDMDVAQQVLDDYLTDLSRPSTLFLGMIYYIR